MLQHKNELGWISTNFGSIFLSGSWPLSFETKTYCWNAVLIFETHLYTFGWKKLPFHGQPAQKPVQFNATEFYSIPLHSPGHRNHWNSHQSCLPFTETKKKGQFEMLHQTDLRPTWKEVPPMKSRVFAAISHPNHRIYSCDIGWHSKHLPETKQKTKLVCIDPSRFQGFVCRASLYSSQGYAHGHVIPVRWFWSTLVIEQKTSDHGSIKSIQKFTFFLMQRIWSWVNGVVTYLHQLESWN